MSEYFAFFAARLPSWPELYALMLEHARIIILGVSTFTMTYATVVHHLHFRRVRSIEKKYERRIQEAIAKVGEEDAMHELHLTPEEAQEILHVSHKFDHSSIASLGRGFALFKTYGIPSIAKLLYATGQFTASTSGGPKRLVDTAIATDTFLRCPIAGPTGADAEIETNGHTKNLTKDQAMAIDPRNAIVIARVNWLHSKYRIKNDDYIYVMAALLLEPIRLADKYSWRKVTPLEREAYFVFWKEIGRRMEIKDIPESLAELIAWKETYEQEYMVPNETSRKLAKATLDQMVAGIPTFLGCQNLARMFFYSVFEDRTREALMFPRPPTSIYLITRAVASIMSFKNAYFALPKRTAEGTTPEKVDQHQLNKTLPRMNVYSLRASREPWYIPESKGWKGFMFQMSLYLGFGNSTFAPGPKYKSEGYRLEELGPLKFENDGHDEVMRNAAKIQGCPVVGPWAR